MEAIEAWGVQTTGAQADLLPWETVHNFEVTSATIGELSLTPSPILVDETGNGVADSQQVLWSLPDGLGPVVGDVLATAHDRLKIKVRLSVTQAPPSQDADSQGCNSCQCALL